MLRDLGQEGDVLGVEAHQITRGVARQLHQPIGEEVHRVDPHRVQTPEYGGAVKRQLVDRRVLAGLETQLLDMKADVCLTDDLNEAGVVPTIEVDDHRLLGWAGDDVLVADVLIGGVTLAGQSGRIGSPRGKVDGYRRCHTGCDSFGAIND